VVAHGTTVGHALKAISELESEGMEVGLVNMHTIKPIDKDTLNSVIAESEHVLIFEEHTVVGGLGSAILEHMNDMQASGAIVHRYGAKDCFPKTGGYNYILETLGLDAVGIQTAIRTILNNA